MVAADEPLADVAADEPLAVAADARVSVAEERAAAGLAAVAQQDQHSPHHSRRADSRKRSTDARWVDGDGEAAAAVLESWWSSVAPDVAWFSPDWPWPRITGRSSVAGCAVAGQSPG